MLNRDGFRCLCCGDINPENLTIDHVVPKSVGGTDNLYNLQTLCKVCNSNKGAEIIQYSDYKTTTKYVRQYKKVHQYKCTSQYKGRNKAKCKYCGKRLYPESIKHHQRYSIDCFKSRFVDWKSI